jgi:hypothetical protein
MALPTDDDAAAHDGEVAAGEDNTETLEERCAAALTRLREQAVEGQAAAVEEAAPALYASFQDPDLPPLAVERFRAELKDISLVAFMKATDLALRRAVAHAQADRALERSQEIAVARGFLSRALSLGAKDDFKRAAEKTIESALLTGGVKRVGPTRAKPVADAPPPRGLAKEERREFKRYASPPLTVGVGGKTFVTLDWSLGGLLVRGATADELPSGEPVEIALSVPGASRPFTVMVMAARVEIRRGGIAVKFHEAGPELNGQLRRLIVTRAGA